MTTLPESVGDWLRSLLLEQYYDNFISHDFTSMSRVLQLWEVEIVSVSVKYSFVVIKIITLIFIMIIMLVIIVIIMKIILMSIVTIVMVPILVRVMVSTSVMMIVMTTITGFPCVGMIRNHHIDVNSIPIESVSMRLVASEESSSLNDKVHYGIFFATVPYHLRNRSDQ